MNFLPDKREREQTMYLSKIPWRRTSLRTHRQEQRRRNVRNEERIRYYSDVCFYTRIVPHQKRQVCTLAEGRKNRLRKTDKHTHTHTRTCTHSGVEKVRWWKDRNREEMEDTRATTFPLFVWMKFRLPHEKGSIHRRGFTSQRRQKRKEEWTEELGKKTSISIGKVGIQMRNGGKIE